MIVRSGGHSSADQLSKGQIIWQYTYSHAGFPVQCVNVTATADGALYAMLQWVDDANPNNRVDHNMVARLNSDRTPAWMKVSSQYGGMVVVLSPSGQVTTSALILAKLNPDMSPAWQQQYSSVFANTGVLENHSGGFTLFGDIKQSLDSSGNPAFGFWLMRTLPNGTLSTGCENEAVPTIVSSSTFVTSGTPSLLTSTVATTTEVAQSQPIPQVIPMAIQAQTLCQ